MKPIKGVSMPAHLGSGQLSTRHEVIVLSKEFREERPLNISGL